MNQQRNLDPKYFINLEMEVSKALTKLDNTGEGFLLLVDKNNHLLGSLNDGDIRRFILKTGDIKGKVKECTNFDPIFLLSDATQEEIKSTMLEKQVQYLPIVDHEMKMVDIVTWKQAFGKQKKITRDYIKIPVIIMAGGKGTRLEPFTKILPKPLIPIGDKPVIKIIMERFFNQGISNFILVLNYKGELIKSYLENMNDEEFDIQYIWEDSYQGTAGGLQYLPENIDDTFIISNCDIAVETDYHELIDYHKNNENDLTIVGSFMKHKLPYGVLHFRENGDLNEISEKPEYDFTVNTGVYVLQKSCLKLIPSENKIYHITDLVSDLLSKGKKVGVFPVSGKSFIDIGQWDEYKRNVSLFESSSDNIKL